MIWFGSVDGRNVSRHKVQDPDEQGNYRIEGILPGRYHLWCELRFMGKVPPELRGRNPIDYRVVEVREGPELKIDLKLDLAQR